MNAPPFRSLLRFSVVAALSSIALLASAQSADKLFFMQRSKNANEVHYDARVTQDGTLLKKDPIDAYWLRKAGDGSRAPITLLQKIAYGYDVDPAKDGTYTMKLTALKERPLTLVRVAGKWRARVVIAGKTAYLHHLYVATDESGVVPKVLYVDAFGEDVDTGKAVQERVVKH